MANKKGPLARALDGIRAVLGIKSKESQLERIQNAAANTETQGKVFRPEYAKVSKESEIQDAKTINDLYDDWLKKYAEGKELLLHIIAAKNDDFANEIHKRVELEYRYNKFISSANDLIKKVNSNKVLSTFQKLGYTKMLDNDHKEIHLPKLTDLKDEIEKINTQMELLRNKKANNTSTDQQLPAREIPEINEKFNRSSHSSIVTNETAKSLNRDDFGDVKPKSINQNNENLDLSQTLDQFHKYISQQKELTESNVISLDTELRQYGDDLKKSAVAFLKNLPKNLKKQADIIIEMSEYRTTRPEIFFGISPDLIKQKQISLKEGLKTSLENITLSKTESEQLQNALTAVLLWQDSNKGVKAFSEIYPEIMQYQLLPKKNYNHP